MITGPQSPSGIYAVPLAIEDHVDFSVPIAHLSAGGHDVIEPTPEAVQEWVAHTEGAP